jgi:hypothetical protein
MKWFTIHKYQPIDPNDCEESAQQPAPYSGGFWILVFTAVNVSCAIVAIASLRWPSSACTRAYDTRYEKHDMNEDLKRTSAYCRSPVNRVRPVFDQMGQRRC